METEQSSYGETLRRAQPLARSIDSQPPRLCPCGREPLDTSHVLGPSCRDKVERHVRRRFGAHRYGGRYAADIPDLIQDCYQRLLAPGGLESFRLAPGREAGDAFRAWLWTVVHYHCNNRMHHLLAQPPVGSDGLEGVPEVHDPMTPEQDFARERIRELSERTVARVARSWRAKGAVWSERLDVLLLLICEQEADTARACERLGITAGHGGKLKHELRAEIRLEWRKQIRDELPIKPGLLPEEIELMIDREIEALFQEAYPGRSPWESLGSEPEDEDGEPESKP